MHSTKTLSLFCLLTAAALVTALPQYRVDLDLAHREYANNDVELVERDVFSYNFDMQERNSFDNQWDVEERDLVDELHEDLHERALQPELSRRGDLVVVVLGTDYPPTIKEAQKLAKKVWKGQKGYQRFTKCQVDLRPHGGPSGSVRFYHTNVNSPLDSVPGGAISLNK